MGSIHFTSHPQYKTTKRVSAHNIQVTEASRPIGNATVVSSKHRAPPAAVPSDFPRCHSDDWHHPRHVVTLSVGDDDDDDDGDDDDDDDDCAGGVGVGGLKHLSFPSTIFRKQWFKLPSIHQFIDLCCMESPREGFLKGLPRVCQHTLPKTNLTTEKQPFEDVSPIKNGAFPLSY